MPQTLSTRLGKLESRVRDADPFDHLSNDDLAARIADLDTMIRAALPGWGVDPSTIDLDDSATIDRLIRRHDPVARRH